MSITLLIVGLLTSCINTGAGTPEKDFVAETLISNDSTIVDIDNQCVQDSDTTVIISDSDDNKKPNDDKQEQISPVKRALVIGIGRYQDAAWSEIHGDRDVPIVKRMLKKSRYIDVTTLINADATKSGILSRLASLCSRCNAGDIVYIHFSGHGQQVTDVDGDEDDGFDEAWIPYDARYEYCEDYKGEKHLIDDEIAVWMGKIKNRIGSSGQLLVVADACHSGDSTRDRPDDNVIVRGTDDDFVIPLAQKPEKRASTTERWLTLSACLDYQANCEVMTKSGEYYGMLTYALCTMHKDFTTMTNDVLMDKLLEFVDQHRGYLPQEPILTGEQPGCRLSIFFE